MTEGAVAIASARATDRVRVRRRIRVMTWIASVAWGVAAAVSLGAVVVVGLLAPSLDSAGAAMVAVIASLAAILLPTALAVWAMRARADLLHA